MRRKEFNGPKTAEQIEVLLQQAASYEPETEAPDDLVARALESLPAAKSSSRNPILAYGACGAAAIVGMGYLTAVMIGRSNADGLSSDVFMSKPGYGGPSVEAGMQPANHEQPIGIEEARPSGMPAFGGASARLVTNTKTDPEKAEPNIETPQRPRGRSQDRAVAKVQLHTETYEVVKEGEYTPAFIQREGAQGETMMTPVMIDTMRSAEKPASQDGEDGGTPFLDTK
jgi:hypothetical protein